MMKNYIGKFYESERLAENWLVSEADCGSCGLVDGAMAKVDLGRVELHVARGHDRMKTIIHRFILI